MSARFVSSSVEGLVCKEWQEKLEVVVDKKQPAKHRSSTLFLVGACIDHH